MAIMAERSIQNSNTQRIYNAIRRFLKKFGFIKSDITDAKVAELVRDAQVYLCEQGRATIAGEPALAFSRFTEPVEDPVQAMREQAKEAQGNEQGNRIVELGEVVKWEEDAASQAGGLRLKAFAIQPMYMRCAMLSKKHGSPAEVKRGQLPITEEDVVALTDVVLQSDSIILGFKNVRSMS